MAKNLGGVESLVRRNRLARWRISIAHNLCRGHFIKRKDEITLSIHLENTKNTPVNSPYQDVVSSSEWILENRLGTVNSQTRLTPLNADISDKSKKVKDSTVRVESSSVRIGGVW